MIRGEEGSGVGYTGLENVAQLVGAGGVVLGTARACVVGLVVEVGVGVSMGAGAESAGSFTCPADGVACEPPDDMLGADTTCDAFATGLRPVLLAAARLELAAARAAAAAFSASTAAATAASAAARFLFAAASASAATASNSAASSASAAAAPPPAATAGASGGGAGEEADVCLAVVRPPPSLSAAGEGTAGAAVLGGGARPRDTAIYVREGGRPSGEAHQGIWMGMGWGGAVRGVVWVSRGWRIVVVCVSAAAAGGHRKSVGGWTHLCCLRVLLLLRGGHLGRLCLLLLGSGRLLGGCDRGDE